MFSPAARQQRYSHTQLQMIDPRISQNGSMPVKSQLATLGPRLSCSNISSATCEIQLEPEVSFGAVVNEPGSIKMVITCLRMPQRGSATQCNT
jgi:hypothetical protein